MNIFKKIRENLSVFGVISFLILGGVLVFYQNVISSGSSLAKDIVIPQFSELAQSGQKSFDKNCAQCHGKNAAGTDQGPPLIHDIYNPGHHGDGAFFRAGQSGVPRHHWPFGNMPAQPQVTKLQMTQIIRYIRELQQANGIYYRPHNM
jgi:mono/diheme cytochrome c family protein